MAIMLNSRSNVYEHIFSSASQPPDSSTLLQPAGIAEPVRLAFGLTPGDAVELGMHLKQLGEKLESTEH